MKITLKIYQAKGGHLRCCAVKVFSFGTGNDTGNETSTDCSAIFCINVMKVAHTGGALMQGKRQVGTNDHQSELRSADSICHTGKKGQVGPQVCRLPAVRLGVVLHFKQAVK